MTGAQTGAGHRRATTPRRRPAPPRSPRRALLVSWRLHKDLLSGASNLVATTGLASVLGFAYWTLAARLFRQESVGYGSAAVSAITLLGTIGMLGLGTVLIGELPRRRQRAGLISAALVACCAGSLVLGIGFAVLAPHFSQRFGNITGTLGDAALFTAGVALTGMTLVFDQLTIGLMRSRLQLLRNLVFAAVKLLALPAVAVILHDQFGLGITTSWVAGMAVSMTVLAIWLRLNGTPVLPRPDWGVLRKLGKIAVAHSWLNLAVSMPRSLIPVLVTVVVSPSANAAFYAAWTLSGFLYIVPTHLSTVLFAVASADPQVVAKKLRFSLRLCLLIGLPAMAVLGLGARLALSLFGPGYAHAATVTLWLLVIGYLPAIPKMLYITVCRAAGRIPRAALVLTCAAAMEVAGAAVGGASGGLNGLSLALLAVFVVEGLVTAPPVLRAAFGRGRHRQAGSANALNGDLARTAQPSGLAPAALPMGTEPVASAGQRLAPDPMTLAEVTVAGPPWDLPDAGVTNLLWPTRNQPPDR